MDYGYGNAYTTTSYGAQGGADGGGFMGGEVGSSPAGGRGGYGKDTVRPVTIKQILDAHQPHPDADFKVDGDGISQITFVGQIRNVSTQTTNITYKLDDGTGTVEVKQWIDSDTSTSDQGGVENINKSKLVEGVYCRVWGKLKAFNNKRHVGAHVIRPITDYNEVNYHLLEATAVHLFFTRGPPTSKDGQPNGGMANGAAGGNEMNGSRLRNMTPLARRLYDAIRESPQSNEGLHVHMLATQLQAEVNDVHKAADELLGSNLIFETVDDNTWATLEYFPHLQKMP